MNSPKKGVPSNFTVSYKQIDSPAILRFSPNYNREGSAGGFGATERWGTPSEEFDPDVLANEHKDASIVSSDTISQGQKSLGVQYGRLKTSLKKGIKNVVGLLGHKHADSLDEKATSISPDRLLGPPYKSDEESTSTIDTSSSSITLPNLPAAETPAFTSTEALEQPTMPTSTTLFSQSNFNIHLLKLFGLFLVVLSCLTWLSLRWRDPRRQVDWAARREERRTKRMYRRAARQQALRNWVWNFRLKYGLAPRAAISWDEKRTRVLKQEAVLEDVMGADIRALRRAHSVVSQITAAEEGRNAFEYEAEGPGRRRSVSTLPGYESEGSQPPSYDDAGASIECTTVVDNFQFTHAETEYTTDSSVISTSPRLSRDGTYSDLDEKFDSISLEAGNLAGSGL